MEDSLNINGAYLYTTEGKFSKTFHNYRLAHSRLKAFLFLDLRRFLLVDLNKLYDILNRIAAVILP